MKRSNNEPQNEPKFEAQSYREFRPSYPAEVFREVRKELVRISKSDDRAGQPLRILDLGCGTGLVTQSLLPLISDLSSIEITLVDPHSAMLNIARESLNRSPHTLVFQEASAENLPFPDQSVDLILVGSAFHWFQPQAHIEMSRVIRPEGKLLLFEYQFPKALGNEVLNQWVKKNFNQNWKAPTQVPRGKLKELVKPLKNNWDLLFTESPPMIQALDLPSFLGHLISQSRYQHFESKLLPDEVLPYRGLLRKELECHFQEGPISFDFYLQLFWFVSKVTHCQTSSVKRK